jgi:hypothetical protein
MLHACACMQALLAMITAPEAQEGTAPGVDGAGSPLPVALFALGNMAGHREIADVLARLGVERALERLARNADSTTQKYVQRVRSKLQSVRQQGGLR